MVWFGLCVVSSATKLWTFCRTIGLYDFKFCWCMPIYTCGENGLVFWFFCSKVYAKNWIKCALISCCYIYSIFASNLFCRCWIKFKTRQHKQPGICLHQIGGDCWTRALMSANPWRLVEDLVVACVCWFWVVWICNPLWVRIQIWFKSILWLSLQVDQCFWSQ